MQAVQRAGGSVFYHCVDVTDPTAVEKAMAEVRDLSGRVDVLVHAAGLEISHMLPDKAPDEFDLVLAVKADGLANLLHAATGLPLGTVVAFSSVAGRFGNAGQTDYSSANALLGTALAYLHRTRPGVRTLTIDWTAWGDIGMATRGSIPKMMQLAGVRMLPAQVGIPWLRRELTTGSASGEVVVAGALGALAAEFHDTGGLLTGAPHPARPMSGQVSAISVHDGLVVLTTLDPTRHPFLDHHRIGGTPVLPGVMIMESFAEAAQLLVPDWHVSALENVDFLAPVKFHRDQPRTLTTTALLRPHGPDLLAECRLESEHTIPGADIAQRTLHATGVVRLTAAPSDPRARSSRSPPTRRCWARTRSTGCSSTAPRTRSSMRPGGRATVPRRD